MGIIGFVRGTLNESFADPRKLAEVPRASVVEVRKTIARTARPSNSVETWKE